MLNQQNWLKYIICYFVDSLIKDRKYLRIGCKKNKSLFRLIDWLMIKSKHDMIKIYVSLTHISNIIKGWSLYNQWII